MSDRTFKLASPHMRGDDIKAWQETLNRQMQTWKVNYRIPEDGDYDQATRSLTASVCHGLGLASASQAMEHGVTPALRTKIRNKRLTPAELIRYHGSRKKWRDAFRARYERVDVAYPVPSMTQDSWGYHPGVHDGIDLICPWKAPVLAICTGRIVRVSTSGWWGLGAHASAGHAISDGDGIVILESTVNAGPFRKGLHFGYGHTEGATVREGELVKAGEVIGHAGYANAAHVHFMVNDDKPVDGFYKGVGDRDPRPFLDYAERKN